jgi:hypothetical protein
MNMRRVFLFCAATVLAGCASEAAPKQVLAESRPLPESVEPEFAPIRYSEIPASFAFRVSLSSSDIASQIGMRLTHPTAIETYQLFLTDDAPIMQGTSYFRRVLYYYHPTKCSQWPHGPCLQKIAVWLLPDGAIHQVYVSKILYPL